MRLERDEVHLWWGRMEAVENLDRVRGWLSDDERRRGERFRRERDARAFVYRRGFLRAVLSGYAGAAPGELVLVAGEHGKPALRSEGDVRFNSSSAGAWVLVGVCAGRDVGVDVERSDPRLGGEELSRLARRVLCPSERARFDCLPADERPRAFLRAWTRKEALLKAVGVGLTLEPSRVELGVEPEEGPRTLRAQPLLPWSGARMLDLATPAGHAACVVVAAGPRERLRFRRFDGRLECTAESRRTRRSAGLSRRGAPDP